MKAGMENNVLREALEDIIEDLQRCRGIPEISEVNYLTAKKVIGNLKHGSDIFCFREYLDIILELSFKADFGSQVKHNLMSFIIFMITNPSFIKAKPLISRWQLLVKLCPKELDHSLINSLLTCFFSSIDSSWISGCIMLNMLYFGNSKNVAISITEIMSECCGLRSSLVEKLEANDDFTTCNLLVEFMGKLEEITKQNMLKQSFLFEFPHDFSSGSFSNIRYLEKIKKQFGNLFQLDVVKSPTVRQWNNYYGGNQLALVQIRGCIMILWIDLLADSKLSSLFFDLHKLSSLATLGCSVRIVFDNSSGCFWDPWNEKVISSNNFILELKIRNCDSFSSFVRYLKLGSEASPKASIVKAPIVISRPKNRLEIERSSLSSSIEPSILNGVKVESHQDFDNQILSSYNQSSRYPSNLYHQDADVSTTTFLCNSDEVIDLTGSTPPISSEENQHDNQFPTQIFSSSMTPSSSSEKENIKRYDILKSHLKSPGSSHKIRISSETNFSQFQKATESKDRYNRWDETAPEEFRQKSSFLPSSKNEFYQGSININAVGGNSPPLSNGCEKFENPNQGCVVAREIFPQTNLKPLFQTTDSIAYTEVEGPILNSNIPKTGENACFDPYDLVNQGIEIFKSRIFSQMREISENLKLLDKNTD